MSFVKRTLAVLVVALLSTACGAPFTFVKRPQASAMVGAAKVTVLPVTYEGLMIGAKTYDTYIAEKGSKEKGDEDVANWENYRKKWADALAAKITSEMIGGSTDVTTGAASEGLIVQVNVEAIEPGYYVVVSSRPSITEVRVKIYDAAKPNDVIYEFTGKKSSGGMTLDQRVGTDMDSLGYSIGYFLRRELDGKG